MLKFLIHRPIAVSMTFIAILILGIIGTSWDDQNLLHSSRT